MSEHDIFDIGGQPADEPSKFVIHDERTDYERNSEIASSILSECISSLPGILFAGIFYYACVLIIYWLTLVIWIAGNIAPVELADIFFMAFTMLFLGIVFVAIYVSIAWLISCTVVSFFNFTFGNFLSGRQVTALCGGVVAFIPTFLFTVSFLFSPFVDLFVLIPAAATIIAVFVGQLGAVWFFNRRKQRQLAIEIPVDRQPIRFRIYHVFMLTLWTSVLLGLSPLVCFLLAIPSQGFELLAATAVWLTLQAIAWAIHILIFGSLTRPGSPPPSSEIQFRI